jgi:hypothetical protein
LQATVERKRAAFLGVLRDDLRVAPEDRYAIPISDADFFTFAVLFLTIVGDGKINYWSSAVGVIECDLKDKFAVFEA